MSTYNLYLTRNHKRDEYGLEKLNLQLLDPSGKVVASLPACSGVAGRQNFRPIANEVAGQLEPIPEGSYLVGMVEWAGKKAGTYDVWYSAALGPVWVDLYPARAIGAHLDGNRFQGAPGTAGCLGLLTMEDLKTFVYWLITYKPERLIVDWGFNTVTRPGTEAIPKHRKTKAFWHPGSKEAGIVQDGWPIKDLHVALQFTEGKLTAAKIGGRPLNPDHVVAGAIELVERL